MEGRRLRAVLVATGPLGVELVGFQRRAAESRRQGLGPARLRNGDCGKKVLLSQADG